MYGTSGYNFDLIYIELMAVDCVYLYLLSTHNKHWKYLDC